MAHRPRGSRPALLAGLSFALAVSSLAVAPAETQSQRQEITARRSEFAKHFREPDGRLTAEIS